MQCGNLSHTAGRCRFTDEQLQGPGTIVAMDEEFQQLEDMAKPFVSMKEMTKMADKRLSL